MKDFLFLDDTLDRHFHFNKLCQGLDVVVQHTFTAKEAIEELAFKWDCVFLDHDLEDTDPDCTGFVVAEFIALHMPTNLWPNAIIIHSWNPEGAKRMEDILKSNGFRNVKRIPFSFNS